VVSDVSGCDDLGVQHRTGGIEKGLAMIRSSVHHRTPGFRRNRPTSPSTGDDH